MLKAVAGTNFKGVSEGISTERSVRLRSLRLSGFRNLATTSLDVPSPGVVFVGANGQGKTNLLEAIHYLALFRSFRRTRHTDAIAFGEERFRVEGDVVWDDGRTRTIAVSADRGERRIAIDGARGVKPADGLGTLLVALLSPDDLVLVSGGPAERRAYLDSVLGVTSRPYCRDLHEFERALRQRNELLRRGRANAATWATWDEALIATGTGLAVARAALVKRLSSRFGVIGARLAGRDDVAWSLRYVPSIPVSDDESEDPEALARAWRGSLQTRRERDLRRGWTTVGPHRDEVEIHREGRPLARFGSQGERRTAAIALRLLEAEVLEADTGRRPILLLDDVFSELDADRSERLLGWLGGERQRFVTSPRPVPALERVLARWDVRVGEIEIEPAGSTAEVA